MTSGLVTNTIGRLPDGKYRTEAGSTMQISKNGGVSHVSFDWVEEPNACCDCSVDAYEMDGRMVWTCDYCEGGSADLLPDTGSEVA